MVFGCISVLTPTVYYGKYKSEIYEESWGFALLRFCFIIFYYRDVSLFATYWATGFALKAVLVYKSLLLLGTFNVLPALLAYESYGLFASLSEHCTFLYGCIFCTTVIGELFLVCVIFIVGSSALLYAV